MREFRTSGSVGAPGEQSPGATRSSLETTSTMGSASSMFSHTLGQLQKFSLPEDRPPEGPVLRGFWLFARGTG